MVSESEDPLMKKIVGIDIGGSSVKLAYFAGSTLKKAAMAPLPDNMVADGRILSMDAMADFLRQAARDNGIPLTNAAVVLPSTEVFTRELTMPAMTEQQLRYNLPYEFRDFLTDEKSKYYFDYSMRDILRDQDGYPTEMTLLACAMLKETADRYRAMMRRAGFKLQVLTPSECAYAGVLAAYYRRTGLPQRDMCIVNLGYTAAYLYIYRGAFFESRREIDLGLNRLEQLVAEHCGVDIHVAHSYVLQNYNDVLSSDYARSFYARIAVEVMKAVNFFNYNNRQQELADLCLCSGGCNIGPLRQALAETTHLHLHTAQELLGDDVALDEPWMYLRAIGGVDEGLRSAMIAEKNGITVDTRTAAPARKMIKCPQKTGINLNLQEDRQRDRRTLLIGILAIAALVTVVVNFGVLQQYRRLDKAQAAYDRVHTQYVSAQEALADYDRVLLEYRTYSMDWMTAAGSEDIPAAVDRQAALDLLEQEMLSHGSLTALQITQNTMNVDMSGMTLDQISAMFARLRLSPIVDSVSLSVASTEEGKAATIMDFTVRIELRQPEEVSQ